MLGLLGMGMNRSRRVVPEVVQSSAMDCGPAALKSFLEGHGVSVSYGRLREACQTDIDGTAIETLEDLSNRLGVPVDQVLLPKDLVLLEEASSLPAIAVFRLPNGNTHFAVVWSVTASVAQIMDPASGRRFISRKQLLHELFEHSMTVPASTWRDWARSQEGTLLFRRQLSELGLGKQAAESLLANARADESYRSLAALDAAIRAVRSMQGASAIGRGSEAESLLATLLMEGRENPDAIPDGYWSVRPSPDLDNIEEELVEIRGVVVLRRAPKYRKTGPRPRPLPASVQAAKGEAPERPLRTLWGFVSGDGVAGPAALLTAALGAATAIVIEALLFRGFLELAPLFGLSEYRIGIVGALLAFMLVAFSLDLTGVSGEQRIGRRLEARLRLAFQEKIPKLGDRYFHSRLTSDMAERFHNVHLIRKLPPLAGQIARSGFEILLTAAAIVWFEPTTAPIVAVTLGASLAIPLIGQRILHERDGRVRSHTGALSRFYLDALLGLVPLRVHGAEGALVVEHEGLLVQWARARLGLQRAAVVLQSVQFLFGYGLIVTLLMSYLRHSVEPAAILLLAYWALNLPVLGLEIVELAWRYPELRNVTLRATEPLRALEEMDAAPLASTSPTPRTRPARERETPSNRQGEGEGVSLRVEDVSVRVAGHSILEGVSFVVEPGTHVAVVGASGAGKSSLFGLLLGWHFPASGRVLVDGEPLTGERLASVRARTAWVDPAVQIWNRSLVDNLRYGNDVDAVKSLAHVIHQTELHDVLERLPEGLQTKLGEGGGLVSGGEGQRIRLARAFLRENVRLVLLDEPFRGLDRVQRAELLVRARKLWADRTLLCITHDVRETVVFDRVLVVDQGRVVEDDSPKVLARNEDSSYRHLLDSERELESLWSDETWRRWEVRDGQVIETLGQTTTS
jgi:ATP-binding cassette subfamily B protein